MDKRRLLYYKILFTFIKKKTDIVRKLSYVVSTLGKDIGIRHVTVLQCTVQFYNKIDIVTKSSNVVSALCQDLGIRHVYCITIYCSIL